MTPWFVGVHSVGAEAEVGQILQQGTVLAEAEAAPMVEGTD